MDIAKLLVQNYNLKPRRIAKLDGGFRNQCFQIFTTGKRQYVCIVYKNERGIEEMIIAAHSVSNFLKKREFPVRYPIKSLTGEEFIKLRDGRSIQKIALYNYLIGRTIPWEAYTRRHLKSIGMMLSDMHYVLSQNREIKSEKLKVKNENNQLNVMIKQLPRWTRVTQKEIQDMLRYFSEVEPWIEKKLVVQLRWNDIKTSLTNLVKSCSQFGQGILHYDFTRGNILFSTKLDKQLDIYPIVGVLDFEKVCYGPIIADVARTLAFLLVDCKYKDEKTVRKRFLISGYQRRGKNKLMIDDIWKVQQEKLIQFFWLRDFWKFLEHNPYEYLYMNEHYLRTRNLLVQYGLLKKVNSKFQKTNFT